MRERHPVVYILASGRHGTLYTGVTSDRIARVHQHRTGPLPGFTKDYSVNRLVWFERHETMLAAIAREEAIEKWNRDWKIRLIEGANPFWEDLAVGLGFAPLQQSKNGSPPARG